MPRSVPVILMAPECLKNAHCVGGWKAERRWTDEWRGMTKGREITPAALMGAQVKEMGGWGAQG